ncbi:MAG TPA: 23S rRNA (adenine(2503)-C(2))-methyltransferase RlmN [Candidatus Omnitrophica bacterium]|nr:23S rRNA (adenine(2503)-C(2))-methyltransferase RlmN [Candidatus Omnitrophota bacterium]
MKQDIKNFNLNELRVCLSVIGLKPYMAEQIFDWIYKKGRKSFSEMSNISRRGRLILEERFYVGNLCLLKDLKSNDDTRKFLFELSDKKSIETVFIPANKRSTVCLSSQVGCRFKCLFCASGRSFLRNLTPSEITSQVSCVLNITKQPVSHIVFMGIGEPMDNYDSVLKAIRILNSPYAFNIGARRITISTSGIIPAIKKLKNEGLQFELSVSLHSADGVLRNKLMPVNKKYPLKNLISCVKDYISYTNRQVTFEYVLMAGVNDALSSADKLSKLLSNLNCKVNLIIFNKTDDARFQPLNKKDVLAFKDRLLRNGTHTTIRLSRGQDIGAACGQLRIEHTQENYKLG